MKAKKSTKKREEEAATTAAEIYQPLKVKPTGRQNLYERMRVVGDNGTAGASKTKNAGAVRAVQAAPKSSKAATVPKGKDAKGSGPFGRFGSGSASNAARSTKRGSTSGDKRSSSSSSSREATTVVMVSQSRPCPRRGVVNTTTTTTKNAQGAAGGGMSPSSPPLRAASTPQRPAPTSSSSRPGPSRVQRGTRAPASPSVPQTIRQDAAPTTTTIASDAPSKTPKAQGETETPKSTTVDEPPTSTTVSPMAPPVARAAGHPQKNQEDWLSMLIPDDQVPPEALAQAHATMTEECAWDRRQHGVGAVVVDFSHHDFSTMFDSHNDSDSIIWDPAAAEAADVMASFPCFSAVDQHDAAEDPASAGGVNGRTTFVGGGGELMDEDADLSAMLATDALEFLQGSDPNSIPADGRQNDESSRQENRAPPTTVDGSHLRSHGRPMPPPMSTVLVCKVTAASTTATTTTSQSSSSSSNSNSSFNSSASSDNSNPSAADAAARKEGRDDGYDGDDGVSDMETDGVEDRAAKVQGRAAVPPGKGRMPPRRPTQQQQQQSSRVPPSEPQSRGEMERRLSFSSLQMMLDQHRTPTTNNINDVNNKNADAAENELEDFFGEDDSLLNDDDDDEVEIDPGHLRAGPDGKEDTYSFIGADYSFGADRSLISLAPY
jgi:hypothetical protein